MKVVIATDGSKQSLAAAKSFKSFADPKQITEVAIVAVIRPLAAVSFADDLSAPDLKKAKLDELSFRTPAENATKVVAAIFDDWGPPVKRRIRSGSPANEIVKVAKQTEAGLIVIATGSRGISNTVLMGSTATRVQHYAECPVFVFRTARRKRS